MSKKQVQKHRKLSKLRGCDLSIITATLPAKDRPKNSLLRAYKSLEAQSKNYDWEWLIQVDGGQEELEQVKKNIASILDDSRVHLHDNSKKLGQSITRNLALRRARGGAIAYLDDDDQLTDIAMETWLEPLEKDWNIGWSAGQLLDAENNTLEESRSYIPVGRIQAGEVFKHWLSPEGGFPHPPSCFAVRASIARLVGGWQSLPQGEDFGWALSSTFYAPGVVSAKPVYIYHKHKGNAVRQEDFDLLEDDVRLIVWDRAVELALHLDKENK